MVHIVASDMRRHIRFPRPRGDGPCNNSDSQISSLVPPPARGWSPLGDRAGGRHPGSPARAGMVPSLSPRHSILLRFPRPRGDGPTEAQAGPAAERVPPPARGWSNETFKSRYQRGGSPARAGMVPCARRCWGRTAGFPRPRGDGPCIRRAACAAWKVPPPARGWSRRMVSLPAGGEGSPARAGMVRFSMRLSSRKPWFPRPRGDGPGTNGIRIEIELVPPPARGWSLGLLRPAQRHKGSPARAGMVPPDKQFYRCGIWFPRPRGDGPGDRRPRLADDRVPPPARGWSFR